MKISIDALQAKLADIDTDDAEIAAFLTAEPDQTNPLAPRLRLDPDKVEIATEMDAMRVESAFASAALTRLDRWRRRQRFERALAMAGADRPPIIYAEGDSWFQFPFMLRDIVNHLSRNYLVWCTSEAGDTLQNMVFDRPEYLRELDALMVTRKLPVRFFILSGAGNDVVGLDGSGVSALERIVKPYDPNRSPQWHIETRGLIDMLAHVEKAYLQVLTEVDKAFPERHFPDLRVVLHGYDYSPTRSVGAADARRPVWARDWTGEPLRRKGFPNNAEATKVVAALIDRLNQTTRTICDAFGRRAIHADLRRSVPAGAWADELHPTSDGFDRAAQKFRQFLR